MWRNYWTVAVRALAKSRTYSIINIAGLAIGASAGLTDVKKAIARGATR